MLLDAALANLEQAHVSTIHTFCADLLRERPVEGGVDPQFTMLTEPQAARLFGEGFRDWLQERLEDPPPGVRRALRRSSFADDGGPMGRLERAAWTLAEWRDFEGRWRRDGFDAPARIRELVDRLAAFHELTSNPGDREDALYQSVGPARRLYEELTLAEQVRPRDLRRPRGAPRRSVLVVVPESAHRTQDGPVSARAAAHRRARRAPAARGRARRVQA